MYTQVLMSLDPYNTPLYNHMQFADTGDSKSHGDSSIACSFGVQSFVNKHNVTWKLVWTEKEREKMKLMTCIGCVPHFEGENRS